ncbi:hypothetical protein ACPUEN_07500 [Algoriphagus yeomjeoni]|uniref:hypothetical protein n=1 Tax=Algoriphagus yeomjeoni TaxID=291403 RepID=UPI003CE54D64
MNIFWLLCGNKRNPSSRIHGINIHKKLSELGYNSRLIHSPFFYSEDLVWKPYFVSFFIRNIKRDDIVIFQKLGGPKTLYLIEELKNRGAKVIFIDCDLPLKLSVAEKVDHIICPSKILADLYKKAGCDKVKVIFDAVEVFKEPKVSSINSKKLIWFGKSGSGKWDLIQKFKEKELFKIAPKWSFSTLTDHMDSDFKWELDSFTEIISEFDISIIPIDDKDESLVKSANRCTQSMALGVPVLANCLGSYSEVIINNENGFISDDWIEWEEFLIKCENLDFLNSLKKKAYLDSLKFSISNISKEWVSFLNLKICKKLFLNDFANHFKFHFILNTLACSTWFYDRKA